MKINEKEHDTRDVGSMLLREYLEEHKKVQADFLENGFKRNLKLLKECHEREWAITEKYFREALHTIEGKIQLYEDQLDANMCPLPKPPLSKNEPPISQPEQSERAEAESPVESVQKQPPLSKRRRNRTRKR